MVDVLFKDNKVQVGDRVKIPKAIMDTLGLSQGDKIVIRFDSNKRRLIIEEDNYKSKTRK